MSQFVTKYADRTSVLPLARDLRSSSSTRTAVLNGKNVSYVKGVKLVSYLKEKYNMSMEESKEVGTALLRENLVMRAELLDPKKKTLRLSSRNESKIFNEDSFLVWNFEGSTGMRNLLLLIIVLSFFGLVLFPVWPQSAKVGVWYVSMTLLLVLLGFILIRLILFLCLFAIGVDFWILPNFFADDLGISESFKPIYSFQFSVENVKSTWPYRVVVVFGMIFTIYWVYTQPTEFDEFVASQRQFVDELYEGTLLSDKSQKEKEKIDQVIPDYETLQKEMEELEKQDETEKTMDELLKKDEQASKNAKGIPQEEEEIADL